MKLAIMQPYFLPYIGYFQLLNAVDVFVLYDDIKYTKKGWINRNRYLVNGKDELFSLPLKADSDALDIVQRTLADSYCRKTLLSRLANAYRKAPYFTEAFRLVESCVMFADSNLFAYIFNSIKVLARHLDIHADMIASSSLGIAHKEFKAQDKVIAICQHLRATHYINASGGTELYDRKSFAQQGIELQFIQSNPIAYKQFENEFIPWLSIVDVLMFNSRQEVQKLLSCSTLH